MLLLLRLRAASSRILEDRLEDAKSGEITLLDARFRMKDWRFSAIGLVSMSTVPKLSGLLRLTRRMLWRLSMFWTETVGIEHRLRFVDMGGFGKSDVRGESREVPCVSIEPLLLRSWELKKLSIDRPLLGLNLLAVEGGTPPFTLVPPWLFCCECRFCNTFDPIFLGDNRANCENRTWKAWLLSLASSVAAV